MTSPARPTLRSAAATLVFEPARSRPAIQITPSAPSATASVLVADGDPEHREHVTATLRRRGLDVIAVADGFEAVFATQGRTLDAAILDFELEGLSAVEVLHSLQLRQEPRIAAWFTVADEDPKLVKRARQAGAHLVFAKPMKQVPGFGASLRDAQSVTVEA